MSHFRKCLVKLGKNVDLSLVLLAMAELAKEFGTRTTDTVRDYYGREMKVLIALEGLYGVQYSSEKGLEVVGDEFGKKVSLERFSNMLVQIYTTLALQRVLAQMGYSVEAGRIGRDYLIHGVRRS